MKRYKNLGWKCCHGENQSGELEVRRLRLSRAHVPELEGTKDRREALFHCETQRRYLEGL